jgi:hypothetical protein
LILDWVFELRVSRGLTKELRRFTTPDFVGGKAAVQSNNPKSKIATRFGTGFAAKRSRL